MILVKLDLKNIFNLRRKAEITDEIKHPPSINEVEVSLKLSTIERELIQLVLHTINQAEENQLVTNNEAKKLYSRYRKNLENIDSETDKSTKQLKLLELTRARNAIYNNYWERLRAVEMAIKELADSLGEDASIFLKTPKNPSKTIAENSRTRKLQPLKEEILTVMEKLREMEVEA